ncbi:hypothetical protein [Apilactobacillus timberlakei]|uniref:Uncharacterized protein n=1 Tax=Apilactobacillus timberlakei TaxID=2008380 RepID=A0ABY2YS68_9LACO|nr:hypothetical protein [Apilactobacillus timberlakei]TPR13452.1 hypothetical protein DY048_05980 [Apilactobacillus timberlakei]TPR15525.1 hypothetical protein DY052_05265 [Apilactobacillus timberlakei]
MYCDINLVKYGAGMPIANDINSIGHTLNLHLFINNDFKYIINGTNNQIAKHIKKIMFENYDECFENIDKSYIDSLDTNNSYLVGIKKLNEDSNEHEIMFDLYF